jgi:hypothetical protein
VLKLLLALKLEIEMFMNERGKVVAKLNDGKCLWDMALLCDTSRQLNDLNAEHRGQQKQISDVFRTVRASEVKLKLFRKYIMVTCVVSFFFL